MNYIHCLFSTFLNSSDHWRCTSSLYLKYVKTDHINGVIFFLLSCANSDYFTYLSYGISINAILTIVSMFGHFPMDNGFWEKHVNTSWLWVFISWVWQRTDAFFKLLVCNMDATKCLENCSKVKTKVVDMFCVAMSHLLWVIWSIFVKWVTFVCFH